MFKEVHVEDIDRRAGAPQIPALLALYRSHCVGGALPSLADINPERLPEHAPNLAVVEPIGGDDYLYVYYGRTIAAESGVEMLGSKVSQWKSEVGLFFCQAYDRAVSERRPIYTLHRAHHAVRVHLWERLVLPVCASDGSLRLVVFNRPREYLDDLLRAVLDASPDGIMGLRCARTSDGSIEDAVVVTANHRAAEIVGCPIEELLDRRILEVVPGLRGTTTWARYVDVVETRRPQQFELALDRDGQATCFDVKAVPLGDGFMVSIANITQLKNANRELEATNANLAHANAMLASQTAQLGKEVVRREALERELRRLAETDVLTGVATRRAFISAAERAITEASDQRPLSLIVLDIDHFKVINDCHGHLTGDKVLVRVGEELERQCRARDIVGRLGGEEFAILLTGTPLDTAAIIAERIRERLRNVGVLVDVASSVMATASFGVAALEAGDSYEAIFARADDALYRAKRAGRDRVIVAANPEPAGEARTACIQAA
jgi:diguanylate cyclase (GGDEF)-like protein